MKIKKTFKKTPFYDFWNVLNADTGESLQRVTEEKKSYVIHHKFNTTHLFNLRMGWR